MLAYRALLHPLYVSLFFYYLFIVNQVWFQYHLSISLTFSLNWFISINCCYLFAYNFIIRQCFHSVLPPWDQGGGNDFCVISQAVGATAKLQEPEWGHIQGGEMILGSQAGGDCFILMNCWYFHKMLCLEFYKFPLWRYLMFY